MRGSGIPWPSGPYRPADRRTRIWIGIGGWALIVIAVVSIVAHSLDRWVPQNLADLAASIGIGATVEGAAVESWYCNPYRPDTFWEHGQRGPRHQCLVRVRGTINKDYELRTGYSAAYAPGRVAIVGGRMAVAWPGWMMFERLTIYGVTIVIGLLMIVFGIYMVRTARWAKRFEAADARIVDVDLLCRKMLKQSALWDFAYDHDGRRVFAKAEVNVDPIVTDGIVTRGAAVVERAGEALLLTKTSAQGLWPPAIDDVIGRTFYACRAPLSEDFSAFFARCTEGPERQFVEAFWHAWHDPDVVKVNEAIVARHDAALMLDPARVDTLLRECRRYVT